MAQILVRDLEEDVKLRLQERAARHGRSMEAEVRDILRAATTSDEDDGGLGSAIVSLFRGFGLSEHEPIPELRGHGLQILFG